MKAVQAWAVVDGGEELFEDGMDEAIIYRTRAEARSIVKLFKMNGERVVRVTITVEDE
jgi:hypothetical protein